MGARPTRREVLLVSAVSLAVVLGGVVAAIVTVSSLPTPTYASDAPIATSLLAMGADLPGWKTVDHGLYKPAQIVSTPSLTADAAILAHYRPCAFLVGPTKPHQVTAVATDAFAQSTTAVSAQLISESFVYRSADPVQADLAAARRGDIAGCMNALLDESARSSGVGSTAHLEPASVTPLGDVSSIALEGLWTTTRQGLGVQIANINIEVVLLAASRAEVVLVLESPNGPVSRAVVDRIALHCARALERQLA